MIHSSIKNNKMSHQLYPTNLLVDTMHVTYRIGNLVTRYVESTAGMY